jgi:hypothetical protein
MGSFDSIRGAVGEKSGAPGEANPLMGIVDGLLAQSVAAPLLLSGLNSRRLDLRTASSSA